MGMNLSNLSHQQVQVSPHLLNLGLPGGPDLLSAQDGWLTLELRAWVSVFLCGALPMTVM